MKVYNLYYEYSTPFGILKNGINYKKLNTIFKNSLTKYESEYYQKKLFDYFKENKKKEDIVNFVHHVGLHSIPQEKDMYNFYIIEDVNESELYIDTTVLWELKQRSNTFFIFLNLNSEPNEKFISTLKEFKKKYLISKNSIIYLSNVEPTNNVEWEFTQIDENDFSSDILFEKIEKTVEKLLKRKLL